MPAKAAVAKAASRPAARKTNAPKAVVKVAYPRPAEKLQPSQYTIQVVASPAPALVEVRINDQPWVSCREALGLYWYDWNGLASGKHTVVARVQHPDGKIIESAKRTVIVL